MGYKCPMPTKTTDRAVLIGARIAQAMNDAELTISALAREAGLERNQLKRLMRGSNEPRLATLERIGRATGKSIEFFQPGQRRSLTVGEAMDSLAEALVVDLREKIGSRVVDTDLADVEVLA